MPSDLSRFFVAAGVDPYEEGIVFLQCDRSGCTWEIVAPDSLAAMVAAAEEHEQTAHPPEVEPSEHQGSAATSTCPRCGVTTYIVADVGPVKLRHAPWCSRQGGSASLTGIASPPPESHLR